MRKIKFIIAFYACCIVALSSNAQSLGEFKPGIQDYGTGKLKKNPKKIYIASFNVYFEVYKEAIDFKQGSSMFGTAKGDATARGAIGINGLMENDIQSKTNQLYTKFINDLKSNGFEVITPDLASKTDTYEAWQKASGPYVVESGFPGVLISVPENYSFFYKRENSDGKKKKGAFGGSFVPQKLSKEMDDAVVADVDLYFMYSENGDNWLKGNGAQVKMFTNYRLISAYSVSAPKENKVIGFKGAQSNEAIQTKIVFTQGKIGLGAETQYIGTLKKDLEIDGVIPKEKFVVYSKQSSATATSFTPVVIAGPSYSKNTKWIDVSSKDYSEGLFNAADAFLQHHTKEFLNNYK